LLLSAVVERLLRSPTGLVAPIRRLHRRRRNLVFHRQPSIVQVPVRPFRRRTCPQLGATFQQDDAGNCAPSATTSWRARDPCRQAAAASPKRCWPAASAGVIGVDGNGHVSILNRSAEKN